MKSATRLFTCALGAAVCLPALFAGDDPKPATKTEKKELRVLAAPGQLSGRGAITVHGGLSGEKETVAFLGVTTSPVSATLTSQLGLTPGSGLAVNRVSENSAAASVLKEHDILLKLDDQLLVDQHQLSVLIRQRKEGDEITLTYLRTGKQATAKVKLGKHEVPKVSEMFTQPFPSGGATGFAFAQGGPGDREEVDRVLGLIEGHTGQPMRMRIDPANGPGFRAMSINTGNSNLVYSDDNGSLELTVKEGNKSLVAKNKQGAEVFSGPVNSPDERRALPGDVRDRLEKLEGMQNMSFHTDGDFQGAETRLLRPQPRGISLPGPQPMPAPPAPIRPPLFF